MVSAKELFENRNKKSKRKITAKQLRDLGIDVFFAIPDHAYIYSDEIVVGSGSSSIGEEEFEEGIRTCSSSLIHQYEPWRWEKL